jgi:hypothetical protein
MSTLRPTNREAARVRRIALAVMLATGVMHATAAPSEVGRHLEPRNKTVDQPLTSGAPTPNQSLRSVRSGAVATIGFIDDQPVRNNLKGTLRGEVKFAQTHTIDPSGNSAKEMPTLVTDRGALLIFTPEAGNVSGTLKLSAYMNGVLLKTLDLASPSAFPNSDQKNFSSGYRVEYSTRSWSVELPWDWMKAGLSLKLSDDKGAYGELAADDIAFTGAAEYVVKWLRLGMLTDFNAPSYMETDQEKAAIDYFQKLPVSKLTFATYLPVRFDKVLTPDGKLYTTNSDSADADLYTGDMREFLGKSLVSTGINWADLGKTTSYAGDQTAVRPYRQITAHNSVGM